MDSQFDPATFTGFLQTSEIGRYFTYRSETDTTMRIADSDAKDGAPQGTVILADHQTKGRGRVDGRAWDSGACKNLLFTLILRLPEDPLKLTVLIPCAMAYGIRCFCLDAWIKWPNDIWIGRKKVAGMLIDAPTPDYQLVGIGINVNESLEDHPESRRSMSDVLGCPLSRERLLAIICNRIETLLSWNREQLMEEYGKLEGLSGALVNVHDRAKDSTYAGEVVGFDKNGFLRVLVDGKETTLTNEEVTIRPQDLDTKESSLRYRTPDLLTGNWRNQLGSAVTFRAEEDGSVVGEYRTAVGNSTNGLVRGSWVQVPEGVIVAFTVGWTNSATSWTGRLYNDSPNQLVTTWILQSERPPSDAWKSVLTNKDTFHRVR